MKEKKIHGILSKNPLYMSIKISIGSRKWDQGNK